MEEGAIDLQLTFTADDQSVEVGQPSAGPLHNPGALVAAQLAPILGLIASATDMGRNQIEAAVVQPLAQLIAVGSVQIRIQATQGNLIEGFTLEQCPEIYGDVLEQVLSWEGDSDVSNPAGTSVPLPVAFELLDTALTGPVSPMSVIKQLSIAGPTP